MFGVSIGFQPSRLFPLSNTTGLPAGALRVAACACAMCAPPASSSSAATVEGSFDRGIMSCSGEGQCASSSPRVRR